MGRENQRVRLTKRLLKEKLELLLQNKPIERISVKEICETAGINRSTFYQHYADQYALLDEIETDIIKQTNEYIAKIIPEKNDQSYLVALVSYIRENGKILSILLKPQSGQKFQKRFMASILGRIGSMSIGTFSSEYMPYFSQFLIMGNTSIIQQWIENQYDLSDEKVADLIYQLSNSAVSVFGKKRTG